MHAIVTCPVTKPAANRKAEQQLISNYWLVSRCWNSHRLSVLHNMTAEKAIKLLTEVRQGALSPLLRTRASELIEGIVFKQDEPDYLKANQ